MTSPVFNKTPGEARQTVTGQKRGYDPTRARRTLRGGAFIWLVVAVLAGAGGVLGYQYGEKHGWSSALRSLRWPTARQPKPEAVPVTAPAPPPQPAPVDTSAPAPPPVEPPQPVPEGETRPARLLSRIEPEYPPLARQARMSGIVKLYATIGDDGSVLLVEVDEGNPFLPMLL